MVAIFILSALPANDPLLNSFVFSDKIKHFIAYFVLGISFCLWIPGNKWNAKPVICGMLVVIICAIFGISDEFHQSFVPGRSGNDLGDLTADFTGGLTAPFLYLLVLKAAVFGRAPKP
jgi:VanZ family protein